MTAAGTAGTATAVFTKSTASQFCFSSRFELGGITKHLTNGPSGNSEFSETSMFPEAKFCFSSTLSVPRGEVEGKIEVSGKQNSLFPSGPIFKLLIHFIKFENTPHKLHLQPRMRECKNSLLYFNY